VANIVYALVAVRLSTRALVAFIAVSAAAILGAAWYAGDLNVGSYWNTLWGGFPRVAFSFSVGLLIYRQRERICTFKIHPLPILAVAAALFAVDAGAWKGLYEVVCTLLILPAFVVLGASVEPRGPLLPVCKFLGVTSYAIYSLHYPLIMGIQGAARKLGWDGSGAPWFGLLVLAALLVGCGILAKFYDEPVRRYLVGALGKKPPRTLRLQEQAK
jgi:peptidoglycan/LPS O-acetylase OafA/YrhL